jgi:hypothetical protein
MKSALYKESVCMAQQTLPTTVVKTNQLMMNKDNGAASSEIRTKQSTQSERHLECCTVESGGM